MAKTIADIEELLGLTGDETIEELLQIYQDYATVTDTEISNIKNISVHTLPTVVRNQEQLVKGRMTNPSINDSQGIPAVLNKRTVLLNLIIDKMSSLVNEIKDKVDDVSEGANKVEQSQTNGNIKIDGDEKVVYTLPIASTNIVGGVKEGNGVDIAQDGTISVNKQELNLDEVNNVVVNNKVDKTNSSNVLYGTDSNGQTFYLISQNVEGNKVVQRTNNGEILVPLTPTNNNGATSKKYVDDLTGDIPNKQNKTLEQSVNVGNTSYTNVEQLLSALGIFVNSLSDEIAQLEGTDTSFSETVTALQTSVNNLQTAWTEFMTGTSADNIINTLTEIRNEIIALQTILSSVDINSNETDYTKDIPSSAKGLATLGKVGGMSYKCNNKLNLNNVIQDFNNNNNYYMPLSNFVEGTYTISLNATMQNINVDVATDLNKSNYSSLLRATNNNTATITITSSILANYSYIFFAFKVSDSWNNDLTNYNVMVNLGSTALPYQPYFEGIRDSAVTRVVSKGRNIFNKLTATDNEWITNTGTTMSNSNGGHSDYIPILPNTTYYFKDVVGSNAFYTAIWYDSNMNFVSYSSIGGSKKTSGTLTSPNNAYYLIVNYYNGNKDIICINKSDSENGTYTPYKVLATQPIANQIQALEGYGWGVNADCYNYIDYEAKKFVQKVARVDLGSLSWSLSGDSSETRKLFISYISNSAMRHNGICALYTTVSNMPIEMPNKTINIYYTDNRVYIRDDLFTDPTSFKSAMTGVYLYYELATPVETDISSYLGDKHIPIEANGSLTFTNTYNQAVPSSITYDCGLVEVVKTNHEHDLEQQKDIDTLKANQKQLQTDVSGLDTRLDDVEEDVSNLKDDVTNLKGVHLYAHHIKMETSDYAEVLFTIFSNSNVKITDGIELYSALYTYTNKPQNVGDVEISATSPSSSIYAVQTYYESEAVYHEEIWVLSSNGTTRYKCEWTSGSHIETVTDTVKQLF